MNFNIAKFAGLGATSVLAASLFSGSALADGMPTRGKVKAPEPAPRACSLSANVALASEYVFRGVSQTAEDPAIQGGFDAVCGMFYAGVWASNVEFGTDASIEIDYYGGIKGKAGPIAWDLGVIYYSYPGASSVFVNPPGPNNAQFGQLDYVELKVGASADVWKDGTVGVTVFFSPDYQLESGNVWTIEGSFSQGLPKIGMFSPTFSALLGYQTGDSAVWQTAFSNGDDSYLYWNVGLTLGFLDKWSLDLRYWDTDISNSGGFCTGAVLQCDGRFVATLKFTY